jgi:hypothetical protein
MIFLDHTTISVPADWQEQVQKKLPDPAAYTRKACKFESLPINDHRRRAGFTQYASEVLRGSSTANDPGAASHAAPDTAALHRPRCTRHGLTA